MRQSIKPRMHNIFMQTKEKLKMELQLRKYMQLVPYIFDAFC